MKIEFYKYQGTGNDFIIMDNRQNQVPALEEKQINILCDRRFGIGADGLILMTHEEGYDFGMKYYNADGYESSMCGNGGRCILKFAERLGIHKNMYRFLAADGEHEGEIEINGTVRLRMCNVDKVEVHSNHFIVNTGSPHYIKAVNDIMQLDVKKSGHTIRFGKDFVKDGINVNFVQSLSDDTIYVRTYERGVEDETLSCGTGVTASALISAHNENGFNQVEVKTPGGNLSVEFDKLDEDHFENIWLSGSVEFVFKGEVQI